MNVILDSREITLEKIFENHYQKNFTYQNLQIGDIQIKNENNDDISVFVVWHISTAGMLFDISARNLAYQLSFGISARILAYQPGIWRINKDPFRHLAYHLRINGNRCGLIL